jgi:hypothetical protein
VPFTKNSASPTTVYKTKVADKDYYVKVFDLKDDNYLPRKQQSEDPLRALLYEKEVYRYIRSKAAQNKELRKYIVQMLLSARDKMRKKVYLFTEDTGGVPLIAIKEYTQKKLTPDYKYPLDYYFKDKVHTFSATFLCNIFTQWLYIVSLLQGIQVVHNNMYFGNLLLVKDNIAIKNYSIFGKTFVLHDHPYALKLYDFDQASIVDPKEWNNPFRLALCTEAGRCKDYLATDLYQWMVNMIISSKPDYLCKTIQGQQKLCGWTNAWPFVDANEQSRYVAVVNHFETILRKSTPRGFFQKLFSPQPPPSAVDLVQTRYTQWSTKRGAAPIHMASCEKIQNHGFCKKFSKPLRGELVAEVWKKSLDILGG